MSRNPGGAVLELSGVSYGYGDRPVFEGADLAIAPGSFHFLTGPSGTGKTTLLKLCYLELSPDVGRLSVFGEDAAALDRDGIAGARRRMGIIHQDCAFLDHLSVAENIALPLTAAGRDPETERDNLAALVDWVGLGAHARALPPELSGGERQRAALARAVIAAPDLILADEPTGNIDWEMSERLLELLIQLNRNGKAVVIATHDLALIRYAKTRVQARVLRIRDRRLQQGGSDL